jgi:formamidopyrimidine-DNA glycosylase
MPEILEVESYRTLAERALGRTIRRVETPDGWWIRKTTPVGVRDALVGGTIERARRRGKVLLLDVEPSGVTVGVRFGMTGRLLVDGKAAIDRLEYSSPRDESAWDRVVVHFADGGDLRVRDPRRLGGLELDPDEEHLGADALDVGVADLRRALAGSTTPLKARLLDQRGVAGIGNLLADEILWRASLDPAREAASLTDADLRRLHRHIVATLAELTERGGSHTGDLQIARQRGGLCPRDGEPLERRTIGGRTTYSCPRHQL